MKKSPLESSKRNTFFCIQFFLFENRKLIYFSSERGFSVRAPLYSWNTEKTNGQNKEENMHLIILENQVNYIV